jgi:signal transduction histidine kinase
MTERVPVSRGLKGVQDNLSLEEVAGIGGRIKVLIVDDEPESLNLLHRTLRGLYETSLARDGREGLHCLACNPAAAVISDQRMPGMTGVEFLAEASHRFPYTQRILLTGYTEVEGLIDAINAGQVFGYLSKPWHPDDLLATLRRAVETHQLLKDKDRLLEDLQQKNRELRGLLNQTRQLQASKIQAERWAALGKLAGMIAHDLRNPLTAIKCQTGLLRDEELPVETRDRSVHAILGQVESMGQTIDELLLFARPEDPRSSLRPYRLSALIASLQEAFALRCEAKGVQLKAQLEYSGTVWIRPPQIYRALENLLQNALDSVEQGGQILIASEGIHSKEIVIRVTDSGSGVPDSIRENLFEPFVTHEKPGGTGLGLAIVKKIVCEHGGRVWEDPWRLKGACFHIVLPKEPPATPKPDSCHSS